MPPASVLNILQRLQQAGHQALLAGGCVRDHLMGRQPKDYDVATSAKPDEVQRLFRGARAVGEHFGVIVVPAPAQNQEGGQDWIEVATFRCDGPYLDGRHPQEVSFSDAKHDAQRRDFTVNGLFWDPLRDEIIDHVEGRADLHQGLLRAIGEASQRFAEDKLRLLRALRFATTLGFRIEQKTWQALVAHAAEISCVSAERIRDELCRLLTHPNRLRGFDLLCESGLMQAVLPEIMALRGVEQPPQWHPEGDVFVHTRLMLGALQPEAHLPLILAVLLHDIAKPATFSRDEDGRIRFHGHDKLGAQMAAEILRRLRFDNETITQVCAMVEAHMIFKDVQKMRQSTLRRFMARETHAMELELHRVDCLCSNGLLDNHRFLLAKAEEFAHQPLLPAPWLNGRDLMALGHQPGPMLGALLRRLHDAQLEGLIENREQAIEWLKKQPQSD